MSRTIKKEISKTNKKYIKAVTQRKTRRENKGAARDIATLLNNERDSLIFEFV